MHLFSEIGGFFMKNTKNTSKIQQSFKSVQELPTRFLWLNKNFAYCLGITALLWIVGLGYYIEHFIGWQSVFAITPGDFGIFVLAITIPLFLLWFLLAYIDRSITLNANAELFSRYIDNILYPDDEASKQTKALAKTLQEQAQLLQKENKAILEQSDCIKKELNSRLSDFNNILQLLDNYSASTLTELNDGVKMLADKCSYITDKTVNSVDTMRSCSSDIAENASMFLSKVNPLLDEISAVSAKVKNNIGDNQKNLAEVKKQIEQSSVISQQHINSMLEKTAENTTKIEQFFYKTAEEYDSLCKRMDTSISSLEGRVEEQKRLIGTQTKVIDHNSELLAKKLTSYGQEISREIDKLVKNSVELEKMTKKQISALKTVNSETGHALQNIGDTFDDKRADLERRCEYAVNSMQNVIIALNKETDKLISFTNLTQAKNFDLQNIAETIVDKITDISSRLALKTDTLKDKAVEVIDKFTEANELIVRSADKINTSSTVLLSNGKEGVKLLEEQNFYINNTLANMDTVQHKLALLRTDIQHSSEEISLLLSNYDKQLSKYKNNQAFIQQQASDSSVPNQNELISLAQHIRQTLDMSGIKVDQLYPAADPFDLWDDYLGGKTSAFTDILATKLNKRQITLIRKTFDDNASFHDAVIQYLFLMDGLIKEIAASDNLRHNELINFAVNSFLDKVYFVLIKALNNAE